MKLQLAIIVVIILCACSNETSTDANSTPPQNSKANTTSSFDSIKNELFAGNELMTEDLLKWEMIKASAEYIETSYCDTTVQLNDSIYYSILTVPEEGGLCSRSYLVSLNVKKQKVADSKLMYRYCDEEESKTSYKDYEDRVVARNKVQVEEITTFLKKKQTANDPDDNVDHEKIKKSFFVIGEGGQIHMRPQ